MKEIRIGSVSVLKGFQPAGASSVDRLEEVDINQEIINLVRNSIDSTGSVVYSVPGASNLLEDIKPKGKTTV